MDRPSQFWPSQARRRPTSSVPSVLANPPLDTRNIPLSQLLADCIMALAPGLVVPTPPPPTDAHLPYFRKIASLSEAELSFLLPGTDPSRLQQFRYMPRRRRSQPTIRNSNPCRLHASGRCTPAAEPGCSHPVHPSPLPPPLTSRVAARALRRPGLCGARYRHLLCSRRPGPAPSSGGPDAQPDSVTVRGHSVSR